MKKRVFLFNVAGIFPFTFLLTSFIDCKKINFFFCGTWSTFHDIDFIIIKSTYLAVQLQSAENASAVSFTSEIQMP